MQLRVALSAGAVHEPRHGPTAGAHPVTGTPRLHPGQGGAFLEERQRHLYRLAVGGRHYLGHRLRTERPQQRHALRARERQVERQYRTRPAPGQQVHVRLRVLAVHQRPQLVRLDHTRQPKVLCPPSGPHPWRLPHPDVVLVDAQCHRRDQVLGVRQPRHRQHQRPPTIPTTTTSASPLVLR